MGYKFNPFTNNFDLTDSKFVYQSSTELRFASTAVTTLQGNNGGLTLSGGTATTDNLTLNANSQTLDTSNTGRIVLGERLSWDKTGQIDHDNGGFFKIAAFKLWTISGTQTAETSTSILDLQTVYDTRTIKFSGSVVLSTVTLFDGRPVVQPTVATTDTQTDWRVFFGYMQYLPLLSTAITATTNDAGAYKAGVAIGVAAGSHASSAAVVDHGYGFQAVSAAAAQGTFNTWHGLWIRSSTVGGSGVITTNIGVDVEAQTAGTTDIGVRIAKADTYTLQLSSTAGDAASGITFGTDTTLYRSAADTLKTDDKLHVVGELELDGALNHDGTNVGLYGVAPVARATTGVAEATFVENAGGTAVNVDSTFGGYTLQQIAQALQNIGILS